MRFHVVGRVLPEQAGVGFEPVVWNAPDDVSVSVHCQWSKLNVHFDWPNPPDLATTFYSAEHVAEALLLHQVLGTTRDKFDSTITNFAMHVRHGNWMEQASVWKSPTS